MLNRESRFLNSLNRNHNSYQILECKTLVSWENVQNNVEKSVQLISLQSMNMKRNMMLEWEKIKTVYRKMLLQC